MREKYLVSLTIIATIILISCPICEALAQQKYKSYTINEKLIIGKKYDGKIPDTAIVKINAKMEEIKALIEKSCVNNDSIELRVNYIKDVNNLKSIETLPYLGNETKTDINTLALIKILKKHPYIDVMVTVVISDQEAAIALANSIAMRLYNEGLEKKRMRVNGLFARPTLSYSLAFDAQIQLVPSKEMIDKAIKGTL